MCFHRKPLLSLLETLVQSSNFGTVTTTRPPRTRKKNFRASRRAHHPARGKKTFELVVCSLHVHNSPWSRDLLRLSHAVLPLGQIVCARTPPLSVCTTPLFAQYVRSLLLRDKKVWEGVILFHKFSSISLPSASFIYFATHAANLFFKRSTLIGARGGVGAVCVCLFRRVISATGGRSTCVGSVQIKSW